ncbi:MAG: hypothetical protein KDA61_02725 [Planctomycetales bacterium]|nr:hypothetical protein [Planctomycetales bacterium]
MAGFDFDSAETPARFGVQNERTAGHFDTSIRFGEKTSAQRLVLPALLVLAWLLFEVTANATLSVLVTCLKFGWEDFRTANWLRRTDPQPVRGAACSWFYFASGVWKTAIVPILAVMLMSFFWASFFPMARPNPQVAEQLLSAVTVGFMAAIVLVLVVSVAVVRSISTQTRVWVHHDLHHSRRRNVWPPEFPHGPLAHQNRGRSILATAILFCTITFPVLMFRVVVRLNAPQEMVAVLGLVFGTPIAATFAYAVLRDRLFAQRPQECWAECDVPMAATSVLDIANAADVAHDPS